MITHQILTYKTSSSLLPPLPLKCYGKKTNLSSVQTIKKDNNQYSVYCSYNKGYSTLFTCLIAPLILCSIKINWGLYPLAFFKVLLYLVPNIIVDNPITFIYMTISNIMTLYIVYLSFWNKNVHLRKKIICLYNSLKKCKLSFLKKINKLFKFIVICLKEWIFYKFKYLKDNLFSILLTLIIIISVANMFRQPIFIFLGKDIFDNFYLYIYIMFSSILPTTYIITIFSKRFKTNSWDFSFRLKDFKEKITVLSILLLTVSLYISYFYIWPLIGISTIYYIQSKNIFLDWILNPRNMRGLRHSKSVILPGLSVTEVFRHFESSFTKDEILSTIENDEPITHNNNSSSRFTQYSQNKWISKTAFTNNIKANAEYSAQNIKAPYLPSELFKSYRDNFMINQNLRHYNTNNKDLLINIALSYFKADHHFYHHFSGLPSELQITYTRNKFCTIMIQNDKPLSEILKQICICASQTITHVNNDYPSPFIVICNEKRITFAMYRPSQTLEQNYPFKKGRTYQDTLSGNTITDTPNLCGIIGLIATSSGVETIPQQNVYKPQLAFYDITNERHTFAINMIFKYISMNKSRPVLNDNLIQTNNEWGLDCLTEKPYNEGDDLRIMLMSDGRLIR